MVERLTLNEAKLQPQQSNLVFGDGVSSGEGRTWQRLFAISGW